MAFDIHLLKQYEQEGLLTITYHPTLPIAIYNYSRKCQFDKAWDSILLQMRGMVLDNKGNVVARPFPKFFNYEELSPLDIPNEGFDLLEKADGSLGILFYYDCNVIMCTKGSFFSEQAIKGMEILNTKYPNFQPEFDKTYLLEIIFPENRIVVDYGNEEDLILLAVIQTNDGIFKTAGYEYNIYEGSNVNLCFKPVKKYREFVRGFGFLFDALKQDIKPNQEGYVLKFKSGFRMKIKGEDYIKLHRLRSNLTPKYVWECLSNNVEIPLENLPDEWDNWLKTEVAKFKKEYQDIEDLCLHHFRGYMYDTLVLDKKYFAEWVKGKKAMFQSILFKMFDGKDYSKNIWNILKP